MAGSEDLLQCQFRSEAASLEERVVAPHACEAHRPGVSHFGDALAEATAAEEGCAVFDVSDRVQIELSGKDAKRFLHNFSTNDINRLAAGEGCEAFLANAKGRILAHLYAFVTDGSVWIDSPSTDEEVLLAHFDRYLFNEDVRLQGQSLEFGELLISGHECANRLAFLGIQLESLDLMQHAMFAIEGTAIAVRRVDPWGCPGYLLSIRHRRLVDLWHRLVAAGAQPAGAQAFHSLRIEHGMPLYGIDLSSDNLAQEAGRTEQAISFTKGCYLGQEPIARIDALGHINRQLCRLRMETDSCPAANSVVAHDGSDIGTLTSSAVVPGQPQTVALAILKSGYTQPGTVVTVRSGDQATAATVF